jgi:DNA-binding NarL/FixJ family response regulator
MKVLLADDHRIVREGLRSLLEAQDDMQVVGEADNGRVALEMAAESEPDVVVMDVAMPQLNGIEATRRLMNDQPATKVVALSMHSDRRYVSEALKAGATAYLLKDGAFEELVTAIRAVVANKVYLSPRVAGVVVDDYVRRLPGDKADGKPAAASEAGPDAGRPESAGAFQKLTAREREVLQLMAEGYATKEIATRLHVSVKTVETHRRQLMEKLQLYSVAEVTKYAIREGLTSLE